MNIFEIIFIGIGLSLDALAVSISSGASIKDCRVKNALKIAITFGGFQAIMPVIGWFAGVGMRSFIAQYDHWVAFVLLSALGLKMIWEAKKLDKNDKHHEDKKHKHKHHDEKHSHKDKEKHKHKHHISTYMLLGLAVATSIDALVVGVTFAMLEVSIIAPVLIIGLITFVICYLGFIIGNKIGSFFEGKIEMFGGLVLIGIGLKILIEHTLLK